MIKGNGGTYEGCTAPKNIPLFFVIKQDSEMKNYGEVKMYSITRDACAGSWMQTIKIPIEVKLCQTANI